MKHLVFGILISVCICSADGQNLVPNNGFESNDGFPTGYGQWYHANSWSSVNDYPAFMWPYASPDYLHMTGSGGADLPVSTFGTVTPYSGNAVMGFITWLQATPEFREYMSVPLISPMVPGTAYTVSFWITNGSAGWYSGYGSSGIGARFSIGPLSQTTHEPIGGLPQCEYPGELWNTAWQYVSFTYTPDQPYDQLTIGNFYADASTTHTWHAAAMNAGSYYFIDELYVAAEPPLPLELIAFNGHREGGHIVLDWTTMSEMALDRFVVERSDNGTLFYPIGMVDAAGQAFDSTEYEFLDSAPVCGVNYYRLHMPGEEEDVEFSEVIAVDFTDNEGSAFQTYPNPASGHFYIRGPTSTHIQQLSLYTMQGHLTVRLNDHDPARGIDISGLTPGSYVVEIIYNNASYRCIQIIQ